MTRILFCAFAVVLAFAACGKETSPAQATAAETAAAPAQSVPQSAAEPRRPANELQQPAGSTDGETVDEASSTTSVVAAAVAANTPALPAGELRAAFDGLQ